MKVESAFDYVIGIRKILSGELPMEKFCEMNSDIYEHYDFDDHVSVINCGIKGNMFKGDRMVYAKDGSFHLLFMKENGFTAKWGRTVDENPTHCPFGNEIADIEITTSCNGIRWASDGKRRPCPFCYKANCPEGTYMPYDKFVKVFEELDHAKVMTQIAFGVDAQCMTNPDVWKIMDYCNSHGVTPNVTVADIDRGTAEKIVSKCGACAVSAYPFNPDACFDTVKLLTDEAERQGKKNFKTNIHLLISEETADFVEMVIESRMSDERLKNMGAIVLLCLKQKGRGESYHRISDERRKKIIDRLLSLGIAFGMDSCGAPAFLDAIKDRKDRSYLEEMVESCESGAFSIYVNVNGDVFPCSFMEGEGKWKNGINICNIGETGNLWKNSLIEEWRRNAIHCIECKGRNECPYYNV